MDCVSPDAYETAKLLCEKYYMVSPDLKVEEFHSKTCFLLLSTTIYLAFCRALSTAMLVLFHSVPEPKFLRPKTTIFQSVSIMDSINIPTSMACT